LCLRFGHTSARTPSCYSIATPFPKCQLERLRFCLFSDVQNLADLVGRLTLHMRKDVGVDVHRHTDTAVPETFLNDLRVYASLE